MTAKKAIPGTASPAAAGPSAWKGRKAWKKKTPVEVVIEQINKLRDDVAKDEEALKDKRRQLQKMEEARKIFESV